MNDGEFYSILLDYQVFDDEPKRLGINPQVFLVAIKNLIVE